MESAGLGLFWEDWRDRGHEVLSAWRAGGAGCAPPCPDQFAGLSVETRTLLRSLLAGSYRALPDSYRQPCPGCGQLAGPYETEDYTAYVGYPAVHACYDHCGHTWTHLHENGTEDDMSP